MYMDAVATGPRLAWCGRGGGALGAHMLVVAVGRIDVVAVGIADTVVERPPVSCRWCSMATRGARGRGRGASDMAIATPEAARPAAAAWRCCCCCISSSCISILRRLLPISRTASTTTPKIKKRSAKQLRRSRVRMMRLATIMPALALRRRREEEDVCCTHAMPSTQHCNADMATVNHVPNRERYGRTTTTSRRSAACASSTLNT
mmetsp:Transcript_960/g.1771  ORF Transcript_960/g.1771 Transcript_960/m.1771 type:complete len:205 (+) Transcript_960:74-688(+)